MTLNYIPLMNVDIERIGQTGSVVPTPPHVKHVGYKWIFVKKRNEKNKIMHYKAHPVAQGFSQCPGIDYKETYSFVTDVITFRYLIT
ncbi:hypothetical protein ACFX2B_019496 [Malus domestica]